MNHQLLALALPSLDGFFKLVNFLLMLSVLVVLHEYGHFLLARRNGVRVNDFAVGFGPTLLKWTSPRSGTNYRINLLPIGGYCAMQGEDGKSTEAEQQREFRSSGARSYEPGNFQGKSPLARLSIVLAGPIANFVLAYLILVIAAVSFGVATDTYSTKIGPVTQGSPADRAGLQLGDEIVAIDGTAFTTGESVVKKIRASAGVPLNITYTRHGAANTVTVTPKRTLESGKPIGQIGFIRIPDYQRLAFGTAVVSSAKKIPEMLVSYVGGLGALVMHPLQHASSVTGPIGMGRAASATQEIGWAPYFQLAAMLSIALGVFNLLPIPALDGGRALFIVAEMVRGRPVDPEKEALVHFTGFGLLMALMVFAAYQDIANLVTGKGVF